ncbi:MAG: peptidase [Gammaproteobacteria bacterium]|nr:MAG: peptidase [Gammaproteobacteria bacterium]
MIISFKHKGLERFFKTGNKSGIQANHQARLQLILGRLNASARPLDMDLPGLFLHQLTGDRSDTWSVKVNGNWRVTFQMNGEHAEAVNYEDYH